MATTEKPVCRSIANAWRRAVLALKEEFASLRTGRASSSLLDQVQVEAYGSRVPISQVGAVSVPEPRSITVSVWDKAIVVSVEKAIRNSGLGLTPWSKVRIFAFPFRPSPRSGGVIWSSWPANTRSNKGWRFATSGATPWTN